MENSADFGLRPVFWVGRLRDYVRPTRRRPLHRFASCTEGFALMPRSPSQRPACRPFRFAVEQLEDRNAPSDTLNAILGSLADDSYSPPTD